MSQSFPRPNDYTVLIPARQGSKRIPGKNFRPLHPDGRCPVQLAIDVALAAGYRDIVVSSDRPMPFIVPVRWEIRPAALAGDEVPMIDVVKHCLDLCPRAEAFLLLQPTQPLRQVRHLAQAAALLRGRDSVVSVGLDTFQRDGTVYAFWRQTVIRYGTIYGENIALMAVPAAETINLNTPEDWARAERRLHEIHRLHSHQP